MEDYLGDMSVIIQFAKFSKGFKISDFEKFIEEINAENLDFLGRLSYPNQWQMRLTNPQVREDLMRSGKRTINGRCCWIYPLNQQEIRGFIHWLPNTITNDQLTEQLKSYGEVLLLETKKQTVKDQNIESDPRYFGLLLPHGTVKEDLPHFFKINGFLCLMIVRGRQPACFHCKEIGHRRVECQKYKAKLIGYCSREPNTASPRQKPRGKRHIEEKKTLQQVLEQIQRKTSKDLKMRLKGFEEEIAETLETYIPFSRISEEKQSTITEPLESINLEQEISNEEPEKQINTWVPEEISITGEDYDGDTCMKDTEGDRPVLPPMLRDTIEKICKDFVGMENVETNKSTAGSLVSVSDTGSVLPPMLRSMIEEICMNFGRMENIETNKSTAGTLVSVSNTGSIVLILEKTKQAAAEILEGTFKKLTEFTKNFEATETLPKDTAADTDEKFIDVKMQYHLLMLEQAKKTSTEYFENTFKKLKIEMDHLSSQFADDQSDRDTKLTKDDIQFAYQMFEQAKETVKETLQNTFRTLEKAIEKANEPKEISTAISSESASSPLQFGEAETTKKQPSAKHSQKETIQSESDSAAASSGISKSKISIQSEASEKTTETEKIVGGCKELELHVSNAAEEDIDKLRTNIREIFASVLAKDESELLPEVGMILKQVESKVNQVTEEMKNRIKIDIGDIFTSFKAHSFQ